MPMVPGVTQTAINAPDADRWLHSIVRGWPQTGSVKLGVVAKASATKQYVLSSWNGCPVNALTDT